MAVETQLLNIFEDALRTDVIVEVFSGFVKLNHVEHEKRLKSCIDIFRGFYNKQTPEDNIISLTALIKFIHAQENPRRVSFMFDFLEICIEDGCLTAKPVLDQIQCSDLVYTKKVHWCKTYALIRKYVNRVDYKSCRNVFQSMISKLREIPPSVWTTDKQQVNAICRTISLLLDSDSCLLPGYLAVNEIRQTMTDEQLVAPWPLLSKLTAFVDRFRSTAIMVSTTARWMLLPVVDSAYYQLTSMWKLDADTMKFQLKRQLPYCKEMYQKQNHLLQYILKQSYSKEMAMQVLGLQNHQKQRCVSLEMEMVDLIISTMKNTENQSPDILNNTDDKNHHLLWQQIASHVIYFVLYQLASFSHMVENLYAKLSAIHQNNEWDIRNGRNYLMWVLLQFISQSTHKNPLSDFHPLIINLIKLLYPEPEPLPLPDIAMPSSILIYSAMCILNHLNQKSQNKQTAETAQNASEDTNKQLQIPVALQKHCQFLKQCIPSHFSSLKLRLQKCDCYLAGDHHQATNMNLQDFRIALICNACNPTSELFNIPILFLVESVFGESTPATELPGYNCTAYNKTIPLKIELLDSLTAHTKLSMLHHLATNILKLAQSKSTLYHSPALVETYSRLLVYTEIESLGTKTLVTQVLPKVFEYQAWGILSTLLEMISYRIHHMQPIYQLQILTTLQNLSAKSTKTTENQLLIRIESSALRLIMRFHNFDLKPQVLRYSDQKHIVSQVSEELNRVLVLTLARSIHIGAETISGSWCTDILKQISAATPHKWPQHTLACFPQSIQEHFQHQTVETIKKEDIKAWVEEMYSRWGSVLTQTGESEDSNSEAEAVKHFTNPTTPKYFLCLLWKIFFESKTPAISVYKILEKIGPCQMSNHVRMFSDFLVFEFSVSDGGTGSHVINCAAVLRDMVWKYNILFIDRLILCLALRSSEVNDVQVAFFIIQYLLIKPDDFRNRLLSLVQEVDCIEYWNMDDWYSKHMAYHQKFPELYYFEGLLQHCSGSDQDLPHKQYLPTYFSNVTLRFLPVLDIVIHRCIEILSTSKSSLEILLDHLGPIYKFHEQPVTYLFNTLHYYEVKLRDRFDLKKKLVSAIIGAITVNKPSNWALSQQYVTNVIQSSEEMDWQPDNLYYCNLVKRLVDTIGGKSPPPFAPRDWRFSEFPNASAHALHTTCVEALALPVSGAEVGKALMNVVLQTQPMFEKKDIFSWMNSVALILTTLPENFWKPLNEGILSIMQCETLTAPIESTSYPYHVLSYTNQQMTYTDLPCTRMLALAHIVWFHMSIGHLSLVSQFLKEEVGPLVETEMQLLYVFHLIGPYFPRFHQERTRCMVEMALFLYDILLNVSKRTEEIIFADQIADFLYHEKYMHIGTAINKKVGEVVEQLQPNLRKRLQFITHSSSNQAGKKQQQKRNTFSSSGAAATST